MKVVKKAIAFVAIIMGFSAAASAQDGLTVRVGGTFPVGAFGSGESIDIALSDPTSEFGGAATGVNAGIKYQLGILGNLGVFASADVFYNGLKGDIKEDLGGDSENITLPSYLNIPVMVGANYSIIDLGIASLWAEAGAGLNIRSITKSSSSVGSGSFSASSESAYGIGTTLAWQAGIGATLLDCFSVGLHYYGLGAAEVKGDVTTTAGLGSLGGELKNEFTAGKINPSMVVLRVGYTF